MGEDRPTVLLFTDTYPFHGPDDPFLPVEIRELAARVALVVVPAIRTDGPVAALPNGVAVDLTLANGLASVWSRIRGLAGAVLRPDGYWEWRSRGRRWRLSDAVVVMVRLGRILAVERWAREVLAGQCARTSGSNTTIAYCWWSAATAGGVARALLGTPIPLVTRMHGFDLYAEQDRLGWIPFQGRLMSQADGILTASKAGAEYLGDAYPEARGRISVSYLGIDGPSRPVEPSSDGVLRIISCSWLDRVKRVDLLASALHCMASEHPDVDFRWTHVGGGPSLEQVRSVIDASPELARRCILTGAVEPAEVRQILAEGPWDVFVNVSASEGLPVSLMEAASFGIPMIATAVGGTAEIVGPARGVLLKGNPTPEDVATSLLAFAALDPADKAGLREASRATWRDHFSAKRNYALLADLLTGLRQSTT